MNDETRPVNETQGQDVESRRTLLHKGAKLAYVAPLVLGSVLATRALVAASGEG